MLERTIKLAVKKRLKEIGAYQHWPVQFGLGAATVDCLFCYKGRFGGLETKAPGKKPTLLQMHTLARIEEAGGLTFVIDSKEAAKALFTNEHVSIQSPQVAVGPGQR